MLLVIEALCLFIPIDDHPIITVKLAFGQKSINLDRRSTIRNKINLKLLDLARNDVIQTLFEFGVWSICIGKKSEMLANTRSEIMVSVFGFCFSFCRCRYKNK